MPLPARLVAFPLFGINPDGSCACGNAACTRIGKHPKVAWGDIKHGDAVPHPKDGEGYGIRTGAHPLGSDCIVVDLDCAAALDAWEALGGEWNTFTVETPRGAHLYFQHPGFPVKNSAGDLAKGIDIRGDGGFVVGPGSHHRSGGHYRIAHDGPIAEAPAFLLEWLRARPASAEVQIYPGDVTGPERDRRRYIYASYLVTCPPCVANAGGDATLFKVVQYGAYDLQLPGADVLELVREHFDPRCSPPWGDELEARVMHKVRSAKESSTRERREPWPEDIQPIFQPVAAPDDSGDARSASPASPLGETWGGWDVPVVPPVYLLEGLIPEGKVCTFFAEGGSVKSWAAFALAIAVSAGETWLGRAVQQGRVLILDYEDGRHEFQRRMKILRGGVLEPLPELGYKYGGPQLTKLELWRTLLGMGLKLVIIDTLGSAMPGDADENTTAFAEAVKLAGRFTEKGCTVVIVAHANKSGGLRGSSAIRDSSDVVFKFEPVSETDAVKRMRMVCDKPGPQKRPKPVNLELSDRGLSTFEDVADDIGRNDKSQSGLEAAILLHLAGGPKTAKRLRLMMKGTSVGRIDDAIGAMQSEGTIRSLGKNVGYIPDGPEARRDRVLKAAETFEGPHSDLAVAAHVNTEDVRVMLAAGDIRERVKGKPEYGYLRPSATGG